MSPVEFRQWMDREVEGRRMTSAQRDDLLEQKAFFETQYPTFRDSLGKVVGFAEGIRYSTDTVHEILKIVKQQHPGKMLYFEPIGFDII